MTLHLPRPRRPRREDVFPIVRTLAVLWFVAATVAMYLLVTTKIDVQNIKQPNPAEDRAISDRRIGRLTDPQLLELGAAIRRAQERRARRVRAGQ